MTAPVLYLDDYRPRDARRPAVLGKNPPAAGLWARIRRSPAARDLRAHGWLVGLLLAALLVVAL